MTSSIFWGRDRRGYEGQLFAQNLVDTVFLKGLQLPGICTVKALPTQIVDMHKAPGGNGAVLLAQGYLPGPIDIEVLLWTDEQAAHFEKVLAEIWEPPNKIGQRAKEKQAAEITRSAAKLAERNAIAVVHPHLNRWNIQRVVVTGVSLPERGPQPGSRVINIKCMEFVPPAAENATRKFKGAANKPEDTDPLFELPKNSTSLEQSPGKTEGKPSPARQAQGGGV